MFYSPADYQQGEFVRIDENGWKVIDPHGVIGFPINEVWAFIQDIDENSPFIASYFRFDVADVKKKFFMHQVLSKVWAVEVNMNREFWLGLALKIKKKI